MSDCCCSDASPGTFSHPHTGLVVPPCHSGGGTFTNVSVVFSRCVAGHVTLSQLCFYDLKSDQMDSD